MKKIIVFCFALLGFTFSGFAQNQSKLTKQEYNQKVFLQHKNTISLSPFNIALSQGIISYERKFGNKNSFVFQNAYQMY